MEDRGGWVSLMGKMFATFTKKTMNGSSALAIVIRHPLPPPPSPTFWHDSNIKIEIRIGCFSEAIIKFTNYSTVTEFYHLVVTVH